MEGGLESLEIAENYMVGEPGEGSLKSAGAFRIYVKEDTGYFLSIRGTDQVILAPDNKADISQYWMKYDKQVPSGVSTFMLVNRFSGQILKQPSQLGQRIQLDTYDPSVEDDQLLWTERKFRDDYKNIESVDDETLVLDASWKDRGNGQIANGNPIMLGKRDDSNENQRWKFQHSNVTYGGVFAGRSF